MCNLTQKISAIADFPDDTEILATLTDNDTVKLWQPDGTFITTLKDDKGLTWVDFSPKGQIIITSTEDDQQKNWQLDGTFIAETKGCQQFFNHDEQIIVGQYLEEEETLHLWHQKGKLFATFKGHQSRIETVTFHPA